MRNRELGEILVALGMLTTEQLESALEHLARASATTLGQALEALGIMDEVSVVKVFCRHFKLPFVSLVGVQIKSDVIALVPGAIARKHSVVPLNVRKDTLLLATTAPWQGASPSDVSLHTNHKLAFALTDSASLTQALDRYY